MEWRRLELIYGTTLLYADFNFKNGSVTARQAINIFCSNVNHSRHMNKHHQLVRNHPLKWFRHRNFASYNRVRLSSCVAKFC